MGEGEREEGGKERERPKEGDPEWGVPPRGVVMVPGAEGLLRLWLLMGVVDVVDC
jgi:hypothetical protein